ncbi:unnamed protein product [Diabrotica balteata]|uniref:TTF-type domain-containing protein n=1 Tax=Diabrotica balteata TaxID=107213 RepID=A0A9N9TCA6_DIABA|nr:unnamed protein product [Diabrotica balteata]
MSKINLDGVSKLDSNEIFNWLEGFDDEQAENSDVGGNSDGEEQVEFHTRTLSTRNSLDLSPVSSTEKEPNKDEASLDPVGNNWDTGDLAEVAEVITDSDTLISRSSDPAQITINSKTIDLIITDPIVQNLNSFDFESSKRVYDGSQSRYASKKIFFSKLRNGEKVRREWLLYSVSKKCVFCLPCMLFNEDRTKSFVKGFNDWKNVNRIEMHESSEEHLNNTKTFVTRSNSLGKIDTGIHRQFLDEKKYWIEILRRVLSTIKFLASRGLAFRGTTEKFGKNDNGNYLGLLELIAQFDPFLDNHIQKFGNPGRGNVSYLSSTICNEFIHVIARHIRDFISFEAKTAKYFSICVDSTPDVSHSDQLTFILRYVLCDGSPTERFITFISNIGHKTVDMETAVLKILTELKLDLQDCRGQSYDNASNMSGQYSGLQALIKKRNSLALFIPCAAHSLNLVGTCAAECCNMATSFFMFVEEVYNFFSASTHRWQIMIRELSNVSNARVPKKLSVTRWSARADSCKAITLGFSAFKNALILIANDVTQPNKSRAEANGLKSRFEELEMGILLQLWTDILTEFDKVSKSLQARDVDVSLAVNLYTSLVGFIAQQRERFSYYEECGKALTNSLKYKFDNRRKKGRKMHFGENKEDNIAEELKRRQSAYVDISDMFGFLYLGSYSDNDIKIKANILQEHYPNDLDLSLGDECIRFKYFLGEIFSDIISPRDMLQFIREKKITSSFPNIDVDLRIFLSMAVTNCSGERSFSTLERKYIVEIEMQGPSTSKAQDRQADLLHWTSEESRTGTEQDQPEVLEILIPNQEVSFVSPHCSSPKHQDNKQCDPDSIIGPDDWSAYAPKMLKKKKAEPLRLGPKKNLTNSVANWGKAKVAYIADQASSLQQESNKKLQIMKIESDRRLEIMEDQKKQQQKEHEIRVELMEKEHKKRIEIMKEELEKVKNEIDIMKAESKRRIELMK